MAVPPQREPRVRVPGLLRDVERMLPRGNEERDELVPEIVPADRPADLGARLSLLPLTLDP